MVTIQENLSNNSKLKTINKDPIKVGIIGYGYSAKTFHLPLISSNSDYQLTAINSSQSQLITDKYPQVAIFTTPESLIANADIDLVIITAPNHVHFSLAKLALENHLHVVVEKPMVTTSIEAQTLSSLAKQQERLLSVFHNRRWDGDFLTVKQCLADSSLGELRYFESHFDRFRPDVRDRWREKPGPATGIWFDLGAHLVDQVLCLFGLPVSLTAKCLITRPTASTTDYFHVQLHYADFEVVLHGSSYSLGPNLRFNLQGSQGSYIKYGLDPQEDQLKSALTPLNDNYGVELSTDHGTYYQLDSSEKIPTQTGCYQTYYQQVAAAIQYDQANPVTADEVIAVMKILELAEKSSEQGQTLTV